eukprot:COSAG01_NODE_1217_length_11190_cov_69.180417_12_plen_131_part_00
MTHRGVGVRVHPVLAEPVLRQRRHRARVRAGEGEDAGARGDQERTIRVPAVAIFSPSLSLPLSPSLALHVSLTHLSIYLLIMIRTGAMTEIPLIFYSFHLSLSPPPPLSQRQTSRAICHVECGGGGIDRQ